jgi:3-methylfumaryl-CoA hydratase
MSAISEAQIAELRTAIGRSLARAQLLDIESLRRFSAAVGGDADVERVQPPLGHWAWFLEAPLDLDISADGHAQRGTFLPGAAALPRRMFASSAIRFEAPLLLDTGAEILTRIEDIRCKSGRSGDLLFIDLNRTISQEGAVRLEERQTLVYRSASAAEKLQMPEVSADARWVPEGDAVWQPGPVNLFRFSAATFNGHRIHYDLPYATEVEGYPALVVHGPFSAVRLAGLAARQGKLASFEFRARAPLFVDQPIRLVRMGASEFHALRCDGATAMIARATYQ